MLPHGAISEASPGVLTRLGSIRQVRVSRVITIHTAIMENDNQPMSAKELTLAVSRLLELEEVRATQQQRRRRRRVRRKREEMRASAEQLRQSIEVIKWCMIGITTVMALALVILIAVVWQIGNEAERIKGEVQEIKGEAEKIVSEIGTEADRIRENLQNPMRAIGGAIGGQFDRKIGSALGLEQE